MDTCQPISISSARFCPRCPKKIMMEFVEKPPCYCCPKCGLCGEVITDAICPYTPFNIHYHKIWEKLLEFCRKRTHGRDSSHNWLHGVEVSDIAVKYFDETLESREQPSSELVEGWTNEVSRWTVKIAGLLHDVSDYKYCDPTLENELIMAFLLVDCQLPPQQAQVIRDICENVSFSSEICGKLKDLGKFQILRDFVSDADKERALGAVGAHRCYTYKCKHFRKPFPPEGCSLDQLNDPQIMKNVVAHWHEKLKRLWTEGFIRTEAGRKHAKISHDIMEKWINKWEMRLSSNLDPKESDYQQSLEKIMQENN